MIYLSIDDVLFVIQRTLGEETVIRDHGLLESALARPGASAFGKDAYGSLEEKAAALTHSLARNHALVDGNKRLSLACLIAFLGLNGHTLSLTNDEAYDLIIDIASGAVDEVSLIAPRIGRGIVSR